ncbi:psbP domain-containing protein 5, chloroplastic isoform X5 [Hevea brasiliensis]|uniref:psbP domain-containing protein 5, chloroplastic isoform X5 n=1 Tax=Hevea brasiliensis TaxID=3981 RepID=UPI0025EF83FA|nr:psbP domain-containing protein 5, chloroplastic isoform X5 [Hevea brasiliensis]
MTMAVVLLCSPSLLPPRHFLRNQSRTLLSEKKCKLKEKILTRSCASSSSSSSKPNSLDGFFRRDFVLFGLSSSISIFFPSLGSLAEEDLRMDSLVDEINAYTYLYPVELPSKKVIFKWVESRKPERYSSAAPLSRPPNFQFIKSKDKGTWTAKDVADSVLSGKSALRVTSSQRLAESSVLDTHTSVTDGEPYWYYEYLVRKSPTKFAQESNLYRHYISSTAERDDMASPFSGLLFTHKELNCRLSVYNKCFNSWQTVEQDGAFPGENCGFISPSPSHR